MIRLLFFIAILFLVFQIISWLIQAVEAKKTFKGVKLSLWEAYRVAAVIKQIQRDVKLNKRCLYCGTKEVCDTQSAHKNCQECMLAFMSNRTQFNDFTFLRRRALILQEAKVKSLDS